MGRPASLTEHEQLLKTANARLHPSLTDPNFLVLDSRRRIFKKWIAELPHRPLQILDVGGRYQPYRPLLEGRIARYLAVDVLQTSAVDVVGSGDTLPFADNTFDLAIATQVFEYIPEPKVAAAHIHSALKPGGVLLLSAVSYAPRFVDDEYWRFTPRGLRETLSSFDQVEIVPEVMSLGGIVRTLNLGMDTYAHFRPVRRVFELTMCPLLNLLGMTVERMKLTKGDQFTPNYSVRARKSDG